jgi:hypothetical protein
MIGAATLAGASDTTFTALAAAHAVVSGLPMPYHSGGWGV